MKTPRSERKKTSEAREFRKLAAKITDRTEFEYIIDQIGGGEPNGNVRAQLRQAVRAQLIPYLKFELSETA